MNRGSPVSQAYRHGHRYASMRPRFMNRGSATEGQADSADCLRFNEAPIHESGKSVRVFVPDSHCLRFNEAPIHESGKLGRGIGAWSGGTALQ